MTFVVDAQDIRRSYTTKVNSVCVLKGISLRVEQGEFLSIMGPSGSGKSTFMNILGCLDTPSSGTYKLEGLDVSKLSQNELAEIRARRLGFVFQSFNLLPRTSIIKNVMLPLSYANYPSNKRMERAFEVLESVSLDPALYNRHSNELSGGQVQRVAIARALVNDPALILADEPTGNLDSATSKHMMKLFRALKEAGKTIVLITHDPEVSQWADRVVHIRDGKLLSDEQEHAVRAQMQEEERQDHED